ncbi:MAG: CPBP family intramembrane metalloprotease [Anaerolineae bacterium]|nr:CPBP family intramembrane metalloprotease [Anaerolineae bacterium]
MALNRDRLLRQVRERPLVAFYVLAYAISWAAWGLMALVAPKPDPSGGPPSPLGPGGLATYLFSTLGGLGPLLALALLQKVPASGVSLRAIFRTMRIREALRGRPSHVLLALAILAWPLLTALGAILAHLAGQTERLTLLKPGPDALGLAALPVMLIHFAAALWTSPLFEEPGWRGYALPRLQRRFGVGAGSAIVGVLWWLWHQPMNLTFGLQPSLYSLAAMLAFSFSIDSLYNLSGRNLWVAMLAHQSLGTVNLFLFQGERNLWTLGLQIVLVIILRRWEAHREEDT